MAQIRTTTPGGAMKYVGPLIESIQVSMQSGSSVDWNKKKVIVKKSTANEKVLKEFFSLASSASGEKKAYALTLETKDGQKISMGSFEKPKASATGNRGDIAEGIIGAAITARFINKNQPITKNDVKKVIKGMKGSGMKRETQFKSPNKNPKIIDDVIFFLSLATINMTVLEKEAAWQGLDDLFDSAVKYANGRTVMEWSKALYENNKQNTINVISDGLGNQTGTKVDVEVKVDGKRTNINISLKAGDVKQFGQVGGTEFEKQITLWKTALNIEVKSLENQYTKLIAKNKTAEAITLVYDYVRKEIIKKIKNKLHRLKFFKDLGTGIEYFATLNEEGVTLVQMNKREAKIYNFSNVAESIINADLNIEPVLKVTSGTPKLILQDVKTKKDFLTFRVKQENKPGGSVYIRNYIEKGALMGDIIATYA